MSLFKPVSATVVLLSVTLGLDRVGAQTVMQDPATNIVLSVDAGLKTLATLIAQPTPAGLDARQQSDFSAHTDWLKKVYAKFEVYGTGVVSPRDAASGQASGKRDAATGMPTGKRQHKPHLEIRKEVEALQRAVAQESLQFDMLTGLLKERHETVMNAIRNIR